MQVGGERGPHNERACGFVEGFDGHQRAAHVWMHDDRIGRLVLALGAGQGAALEAFALLEVEPPCLLSLAKREEEVYRPGEAEPLRLSRHSAALRLLQYVRDEAHRFAQHYHHLLRRKKLQGE